MYFVFLENNDWIGYWGKHMKAQGFKSIHDYQKVEENNEYSFNYIF